jgi:hypothetical protein
VQNYGACKHYFMWSDHFPTVKACNWWRSTPTSLLTRTVVRNAREIAPRVGWDHRNHGYSHRFYHPLSLLDTAPAICLRPLARGPAPQRTASLPLMCAVI